MFNKKKYYAIFSVRQLGSHNVIGSKRISSTTKKVSYKSRSFFVDIENPSYVKGNKVFYFFSISSQQQLCFFKSDDSSINPEVIDLIMTQNIVKQLTSNLDNEFKANMTMIIIGLVIGALSGYIVGQFLLQK